MPTIIYLHGFLSSPLSKKAQQTKAWLAENFPGWRYECPLLSPHPALAKQAIISLLGSLEEPKYLIGSSLGGFWSTWAIEQGLANKAVLINPAVKPHLRFQSFVGQSLTHYYSDERYTMTEQDLLALNQSYLETLQNKKHYCIFLQTGDEVLDYRHAEQYYADCQLIIEQGGDHSFTGFEEHLPAIIRFFNEKL